MIRIIIKQKDKVIQKELLIIEKWGNIGRINWKVWTNKSKQIIEPKNMNELKGPDWIRRMKQDRIKSIKLRNCNRFINKIRKI